MICINSITICPESVTITKGKWYCGAYAQVCPTNATCQCVTWHSSNPNVANVNQNGYIFGVSEGAAVIYATAQDGSGAVGFCNVTVVSPVKVSSVTVTPSTKTVNVGDSFGLSATVCPDNADDKRIRWTSCDCNIADVDYLTGCVTAKSAGTTCICANAIDGSGVQGGCEVKVNVPDRGTDSIGVFRMLSMHSAAPDDTETEAPVMRGIQFSDPQNENYKIRFVSQIKTLNYKRVGYEVHYKIGDAAPVADIICLDKVYESLLADGEPVYPDEGFEYFVLGVKDSIPQNTVVSFKIKPFAITLEGEYVYGEATLFYCENAQKINYYYISNKTNDSKVISYNKALDGYLKGVSYRGDVCVEPLTRVGKQIWRITNISGTSDGQIKAYFDEDYGFNAYRNNTESFNCDLIKVAGNEDANVRFVDQGNGYYKIRLASDQYSNYYLTLEENSNDVRWRNTNEGERQLWKLNAVDWEEYEAEQVEYHLIPQIATDYALYASKNTPISRLTEDTEVRLKEFSYMNRQRWLVKTSGTSKRLYNQYGDNFVLCKKDEDKVYVSNDLSNECDITIEPYNATNMVEIKLTQSNLYLTASGTGVTWESYNSSNHNSQLWELRAFSSDCYSGCDIGSQITETTVKTLKKGGEKFVFRYYKPVTIKGHEITKFDNSGLEATITALGKDGLNICQKSKAEINIDHDIDASSFVNYVNNLSTSDVYLHREKTLTLNEISYFRKNQLKIGSIYQDDGEEIEFFDPRHAQIDALCALMCAKILGQPKNTTIYFGVDKLFYTSSQLDTIKIYFDIVRKIVNHSGYTIGVYGGDRVCKKVKDNMVNQVNGAESPILTFIGQAGDAWDNYPEVVNEAEIRQGDYFKYNEVTFDRNVALKPNYGFWE